jgi:hypothetical protein
MASNFCKAILDTFPKKGQKGREMGGHGSSESKHHRRRR